MRTHSFNYLFFLLVHGTHIKAKKNKMCEHVFMGINVCTDLNVYVCDVIFFEKKNRVSLEPYPD